MRRKYLAERREREIRLLNRREARGQRDQYANREGELEQAAQENNQFSRRHPWWQHLKHFIGPNEVTQGGETEECGDRDSTGKLGVPGHERRTGVRNN
jgi:hypothetical protein